MRYSLSSVAQSTPFDFPKFEAPSYRIQVSRPTPPAIRALVLFSAVFLYCIIYGHLNFYRDPLSIFYDESRAFVRWYSTYRQNQAESFIERVKELKANGRDLNKEVLPKGSANASVCATFLTVARKGVDAQYLDNSLASMLDRMTPEERQEIDLKIFFADIEPENHPSWHEPWVRDLVDEIYTYSNVSTQIAAKSKELHQAHNPQGKGAWDYSIPLKHCYDTSNAPYIAVFEDDIIIAQGWFAKAMLALREIRDKMERENRVGRWMYLRLFNQERSTGWKSRKLGSNREFSISLILGMIMWAIIRLSQHTSKAVRRHVDGWTTVVICCLMIPSFVMFFFQAGKASLLPPTAGLKEEPFGCCAQGLIYNREHIPGAIWLLQLQDRPEGQDEIVVDYATYYQLARFSLYPMSVQHVGLKTTIHKDQTESQKVWSMAFESLDADRLCWEHGKNVQKLYGVSLPPCH